MFLRFLPSTLRKKVGRLLAVTALGISAAQCHGASADFPQSQQLSRIWQQEFSLPRSTQPPAKVPTASGALHLRPDQPHPAVVRVIVPEEGATSYGSGTLVDLRDQFGLVITNWHVVRDANGMVEVVFPGGFTSKARALKVDPDWDLAALVIWRPPVEPVKIAPVAPKPGEQLTICGYGQGRYRSATGRCTQYYSPRQNFPQHMVELDVEARQGDSGGPIFNRDGELAGVLFGAGQGTTLGSFGGRVENFLASLAPDIGQHKNELLAANDPPPSSSENQRQKSGIQISRAKTLPQASASPLDDESTTAHIADSQWKAPQASQELAALWPKETEPAWPQETPTSKAAPSAPKKVALDQLAPRAGTFEQMKTVLAAIGLLSIAVLILRAAR